MMNSATIYIGLAARLSGTTPKAIRHYENLGLLREPQRQGKYRVYSEENIEILRFIKCAQSLGFKLKELENILSQYDGRQFPWATIFNEIQRKKADLLSQMKQMEKLHEALEQFEQEIETAKSQCFHEAHRNDQQRVAAGAFHNIRTN